MKNFFVFLLAVFVSLLSHAADITALRDYQQLGGTTGGVKIKLHDNGDGTYSESSYSQGAASANTPWRYAAAAGGISNSTTAVTIATAAGTGQRNYITSLQVASSTLGTATELVVRDGASGTVIWRHYFPTTGNFGFEVTFPAPLRSTANTLLEVAEITANGTGSIYFNAQGYIAP